MHRNNYNNDRLDRVKQFKANCIIAFKIKEIFDDDRQHDVDKIHVRQILSDLNLEHLEIYDNGAFEVKRVGRYDPSKTRPMRIRFKNNMTRETVIKNAWMLKFSIRYSDPEYPEGIFLSRDLTKEDRAIERTQYILRKQQRSISTNNSNSANCHMPKAILFKICRPTPFRICHVFRVTVGTFPFIYKLVILLNV